MRRSFAIMLLITMVHGDWAMAGMCSSRDGQKYCSCEYDQECTSSENACACIREGGGSQAPVLSAPKLSSQAPVIRRTPEMPRRESVPAPAVVDDDERSPADYVRLAQSAVAAGRFGAAAEFIEKGQTRLLDRSVALNKTFDPITDEPIKQLSAAKQALLNKNREGATMSLDAALAAMK